MVEVCQNVVRFEVRKDVAADDVFENFAGDGGERDRSVFEARWRSPFLKAHETFAESQSVGSFPLSRETWKMIARDGPIWLARVFRT